MKIIVRTEKWNTRNGIVVKAVVRKADGTLIGATNQTETIKTSPLVSSNIQIVGK